MKKDISTAAQLGFDHLDPAAYTNNTVPHTIEERLKEMESQLQAVWRQIAQIEMKAMQRASMQFCMTCNTPCQACLKDYIVSDSQIKHAKRL